MKKLQIMSVGAFTFTILPFAYTSVFYRARFESRVLNRAFLRSVYPPNDIIWCTRARFCERIYCCMAWVQEICFSVQQKCFKCSYILFCCCLKTRHFQWKISQQKHTKIIRFKLWIILCLVSNLAHQNKNDQMEQNEIVPMKGKNDAHDETKTIQNVYE